jgi:UDP-N-acetylmuramoyl-L-alanyl-D-glutamate--2,6-diaminopimelate ligase
MVDDGLTHVSMEVSSHALDLYRVCGTRFRTAVFTSLSDREHLDYHQTLERYRDTKARLFEMLEPDATAVINADDPVGAYMAERAACPKLWFGMSNEADVSAEIVSMDMNGSVYRLETPLGSAEVRSPMVGEFNVMNDLAAAAAALAADVGLDAIVCGLETGEAVPGRLEKVDAPGYFPLVDYAHNEGALESVLRAIRRLAEKRVLIVFGAGGDRDRTKRPAMGATAEKYCDLVFLTADNSRSEDTSRIIAEIELGMSGARPRYVVPDREMAIRAAVEAAQPGDVILVAGKGHETYQIFGQIKTPFDDREVLRQAIAECESSPRRQVPAEA